MTSSLCLDTPALAGAGTPVSKAIGILVADDHDVVCAGLARLIAAEPDMVVCGTASNGLDALEKAAALKPDIAILDMCMSGLNGLECARALRKKLPGCEVLLFTGVETDELMQEAFASGAKSFILKSDARTHLLAAIRALALHRPYFTSKVSAVIFERLLHRVRDEPESDSTAGAARGRLSRSETEMVRRLALGDDNRELAEKLGLNVRTMEGRRAALMRKMHFNSLADLVRYAVRNGIVEV